jgi:hypothetical protein
MQHYLSTDFSTGLLSQLRGMFEHFKLPVNDGKHNYYLIELLKDSAIFHSGTVCINNGSEDHYVTIQFSETYAILQLIHSCFDSVSFSEVRDLPLT